MSSLKSKSPALLACLVAGALAGSVLTMLALREVPGGSGTQAAAERKPLYWVAPMDPSYRSDKPGKSPMGMDLVPVYAEDAQGGEAAGTVRIGPEVVNNLGVRTAAARRRPLGGVIRTVGYVQYDQDMLIHIHPRVQGWVEKLYVKASGDPVAAGQPLYDLYSPELVNAQEELLLALNRDNRLLVGAAEDRLRSLQVPDALVADVRKTRKVHQTVTFYSPQAGVVDNLNIREGFYVQPGTTLMSIGSLDHVWVEAEVFERQAAQVAVGMPVTMTLDYLPGREWQGVVDYVYPSLDEKTRTLRVRLRFDNADGALRPNMFAQVVMQTPRREVLAVPRESVIRTGAGDRVVLALGQGRFRAVPVTLGAFDEQYAEILDGLAAGERVVTSAQFLLDSESSRSAGFERMQAPGEHHHG